MKKSPPRVTGELAERAFWLQLHVFQAVQWIVTIIELLVLLRLESTGKAFFGVGPQLWYMVLLKVALILVPGVFAAVGFMYLGFLLGAVLGVVLARMLIPQLHMPDARSVLLQFYSDPRWLYQSNGTKRFPWWVSLWGGMAKNKRLIGWCKQLAAATISWVYGEQRGVPGWGD